MPSKHPIPYGLLLGAPGLAWAHGGYETLLINVVGWPALAVGTLGLALVYNIARHTHTSQSALYAMLVVDNILTLAAGIPCAILEVSQLRAGNTGMLKFGLALGAYGAITVLLYRYISKRNDQD